MEDPFLLDQNSVEAKLAELGRQLQRWRQLRDAEERPPDDGDEFSWLTNELQQGAKSIGWDLDDLEETLKLMSASPRAPGGQQLTTAACSSRLAFVANARRLLQDVAREVQQQQQQQQQQLTDVELGIGSQRRDGNEAEAEAEARRRTRRRRRRLCQATGCWLKFDKLKQQQQQLAWKFGSDSLASSFPSVDVGSLRDLRRLRFHNSDWAGGLRRHRLPLALAAAAVVIATVTILALVLKANGGAAEAAAAAKATTPVAPVCHWWNIDCNSGAVTTNPPRLRSWKHRILHPWES